MTSRQVPQQVPGNLLSNLPGSTQQGGSQTSPAGILADLLTSPPNGRSVSRYPAGLELADPPISNPIRNTHNTTHHRKAQK